jgi:hypothetical protein
MNLECDQANCDRAAAFSFDWPGSGSQVVCNLCAPKVQKVAEALGFCVTMRPLDDGQPAAREVSMQELSDCGLNPFAVQLLYESFSRHPRPVPVTFLFRGVRFSLTMEPEDGH